MCVYSKRIKEETQVATYCHIYIAMAWPKCMENALTLRFITMGIETLVKLVTPGEHHPNFPWATPKETTKYLFKNKK